MKLTLTPGPFDDWWVIERAEHEGRKWWERVGAGASLRCSSRFSDADVEGTSAEMLAIAEAIETRSGASFKRCAVATVKDAASFWSPRNSQEPGGVSLDEADELAKEIRRKIGGAAP
jgi:hypothetical protein